MENRSYSWDSSPDDPQANETMVGPPETSASPADPASQASPWATPYTPQPQYYYAPPPQQPMSPQQPPRAAMAPSPTATANAASTGGVRWGWVWAGVSVCALVAVGMVAWLVMRDSSISISGADKPVSVAPLAPRSSASTAAGEEPGGRATETVVVTSRPANQVSSNAARHGLNENGFVYRPGLQCRSGDQWVLAGEAAEGGFIVCNSSAGAYYIDDFGSSPWETSVTGTSNGRYDMTTKATTVYAAPNLVWVENNGVLDRQYPLLWSEVR